MPYRNSSAGDDTRPGARGVRGISGIAIGAAAAVRAGRVLAQQRVQSPPSGSASTTNLTTFVVARTGDIDKLDPQLATAFQTQQTLNLVYSTLVTTSADR